MPKYCVERITKRKDNVWVLERMLCENLVEQLDCAQSLIEEMEEWFTINENNEFENDYGEAVEVLCISYKDSVKLKYGMSRVKM